MKIKMKNASYAKFWEIYKKYEYYLNRGLRPDIARKETQTDFRVSAMTLTMVIKLCDDQISLDFYNHLKNNRITTDAGFQLLRHLNYDYWQVDNFIADVFAHSGKLKITTNVLKTYLRTLRNEVCISLSQEEFGHIGAIKQEGKTHSDIVYLAVVEYLERNPIPIKEKPPQAKEKPPQAKRQRRNKKSLV